ncbi:hypothetical protein BHM03_00002303 [Ensete ventricosum]|nr:hypothetical protein BHM03_00002303 [Ensete ventricosum]
MFLSRRCNRKHPNQGRPKENTPCGYAFWSSQSSQRAKSYGSEHDATYTESLLEVVQQPETYSPRSRTHSPPPPGLGPLVVTVAAFLGLAQQVRTLTEMIQAIVPYIPQLA